jgi:NADH-quinone oxidoreductase subunit E
VSDTAAPSRSSILSEATRAAIRQEVARYPDSRSSLIPALRLAQQQTGWLSSAVIDEVAELVGEDPNALASLATFYDMFYLEPVGRYIVSCCSGFACYLNGGDGLIDYLSERLGVPVGGTTPDGLFTLQTMECLAGCGIAPMLLVDGVYHGDLTPERVDALIADLRAKAQADPTPFTLER